MSQRSLTPAELKFLAEPRGLARVATVDAAGVPHVVPSGWQFEPGSGELLLTGHDVGRTRRVRHLRENPYLAVVIDGVDTSQGWHPWALTMRGPARYDAQIDAIRLTPLDVASWGLDTSLTQTDHPTTTVSNESVVGPLEPRHRCFAEAVHHDQ